MKGQEVLLSSESDEWYTPPDFFLALDKEFGFTLDPCSTHENARCKRHYTLLDNGLLKDWGTETVFCNPPYSRIGNWVAKCYSAAQHGATVVMLIPSRTDTEYWHRYCMKGEIRFIKGRLRFGGAKHNAPFPSAVVVFRPKEFKLVPLPQTTGENQ